MKNDLTNKIQIPRPQFQFSDRKDPTSSIKLSEISTLKKNQSKIENKIRIEQSLSEIRLEEVNSFNDPNITYLSMLKKPEKQKENNITNDEEILPTNLSTKEKVNSPKDKIKIINFKIDNESKIISGENDLKIQKRKSIKNVNFLTQSQFSETSFINGEEKMKNLVKKSKKSCNTSRSIRSISKPIIDKFLNKNNVIEIKNYNSYSNFELSKIIFDILHEAPPETVILLPPRYISLPHLILTYPIFIRGSPGTLVEINNGNIIISNDLQYNTNEPNGKIYISECSFVFNLEIKSFIEKVNYDEVLSKNVIMKNGKYIMPLIKLLNNTSVEVHDCDFRAILHNEENIIDSEENRLIYETCFYINDDLADKEQNSELSLFSTICSNFYRVLAGDNSSSILLENCHLSDCINDAINIKNVKNLMMKNNIIANCNYGIKVHYDYTNCNNLNSVIKLFENEITQNNKIGINISSFNNMSNVINFNFDFKFKAQLNVEIRKNKLYQNKQNAISIENIFADIINISENEIKYNIDAGITLNSIYFNNNFSNKFEFFNEKSVCKLINQESSMFLEKNSFKDKFSQLIEKQDFNLILNKNNVFENKNNKGMLISNLKNCKLFMDGSMIYKNLTGLELTNFSKNSIDAVILNCSFHENMGDGINLTNSSLNNFLIKNNRFIDNYNYGCTLKLNEYNYSLQNKKEAELKYNIPFVFLLDCELSGNKNGGIFLKNSYLNIDNCRLKDNGNWAIEIPLETNKCLIKLINYENKLNLMMNNPIGSVWGTLANKKSLCSDKEGCLIL